MGLQCSSTGVSGDARRSWERSWALGSGRFGPAPGGRCEDGAGEPAASPRVAETRRELPLSPQVQWPQALAAGPETRAGALQGAEVLVEARGPRRSLSRAGKGVRRGYGDSTGAEGSRSPAGWPLRPPCPLPAAA